MKLELMSVVSHFVAVMMLTPRTSQEGRMIFRVSVYAEVAQLVTINAFNSEPYAFGQFLFIAYNSVVAFQLQSRRLAGTALAAIIAR